MKANAITRIVLYSILTLLLAGLLIHCLCASTPSGEYTTSERRLNADAFSELEIEWAAGTITIQTGDTDQIVIQERKDANDDTTMVTTFGDDTLTIQYSQGASILSNVIGKDLTITVPRDWRCSQLEIEAAAVHIDISGLSVDEIDISGASNEVTFNGAVKKLSCDGASCKLAFICSERPDQIDIDGASCDLTLNLPQGCGFRAKLDGLSCQLDTDLAYSTSDGYYRYGDEHCSIDIDGISCNVSVAVSEEPKE